ncbi:hypothetical protein ACWGR4_30675 [Embleya sp. NPDC055664]
MGAATSGAVIAAQWAGLPPEHMRIALKALEPQLVRDHEVHLTQARAAEARDRRAFRLLMTGQVFGFVIALATMSAAAVVGVEGHVWLAAVLSGPSVIALAKLFVIRRTDNAEIRAAARVSVAAAQSVPPSPTAPPA